MKEPLCTCCLEPVNDATEPSDLCSEATGTNNGIGWKIKRCPMHAAAPALYEALVMWRSIFHLMAVQPEHALKVANVIERTDAALALVDAGVSPMGESCIACRERPSGFGIGDKYCVPCWGARRTHKDIFPENEAAK